MTNYERIKAFDKEHMALILMCPHQACMMEEYRCSRYASEFTTGNCGKCILDWLDEEEE